jgi:hypothetical protein
MLALRSLGCTGSEQYSVIKMETIEADQEFTWPRALRDAISKNEEEISSYQAVRAQIDRAAQADVSFRINRPTNPSQTAWDSVLEIATEAVSGKTLLGLHAMRLTTLEQSDVQKRGLRVLSEALLSEKRRLPMQVESCLIGS